jgi:hypothetical protein
VNGSQLLISESRFPFHPSRFALHLTLLVCILTTPLAGVGCRSGGIRVRSWEEAISFAQRQFGAAGDLEGRLEGYAVTAAELSARIDLLDQAWPALELIDELRDVRVPLIGNGWQILLTLLGLVTVDGARIIDKLEEVLRSLAQFKHSLDDLDGLPALAEAVHTFRTDPTRHTLLALSSISASVTPSLRQLYTDLGEVLVPLEDVAGGFSGLVGGLRSVADTGVPLVSDAAGEIAERLSPIQEPLLALQDELKQLYQGIEADTPVLENIQEAVHQAQKHGE